MATKKKAPAKRPRGGQTIYTTAIANKICVGVAEGVSLREICRGPGMPSWRTVNDWIIGRDDFATAYARARVIGFDAIAQETMRIADTPLEGIETTTKADGGVEVKRGDMLAHRRLQIDTRRWLLSKWDPKRYGDKLALAGDADAPLTINVVTLTDAVEQVRAWQKPQS